MTAGRPLRGPDREGGGFAAAHLQGRAAALWPGDAPCEGTGPPLSVKAGCDRGATADRPAAWHRYTRSPAWSAEPPAAPSGRRSGQAQACPSRGTARPLTAVALRPADAGNEGELAFDRQKRKENYTNSGPGSQPGNLVTAEPPGEAASHRTRCARNPGRSRELAYASGVLGEQVAEVLRDLAVNAHAMVEGEVPEPRVPHLKDMLVVFDEPLLAEVGFVDLAVGFVLVNEPVVTKGLGVLLLRQSEDLGCLSLESLELAWADLHTGDDMQIENGSSKKRSRRW